MNEKYETKWAKVIAYSVCSKTEKRIITYQFKFWKPLLAELNTHRALSRNAASSRAVPSKKIRERLIKDYFTPDYWGKNKKGMSASEGIDYQSSIESSDIWDEAFEAALEFHEKLEKLNVHKQLCNRILEPFMYVDVVVTATELKNFFSLRNNVQAQPEFMRVAEEAEMLWHNVEPELLNPGEWHLPFISKNEKESLSASDLKIISSARCARVSYYLPDTKELSTLEKDIELGNRLKNNGHLSPFEHPAMALESCERHGNFVGWKQYRKFIQGESRGDYIGDNQ